MATQRVVSLVDMDCFYVQVEQRFDQTLAGKPCAVVQYNDFKGGGKPASKLKMANRRVIALVDMDCFYVQVEQRLNVNLAGKPCAVLQNRLTSGGIISVNYEARARGVQRHFRGEDAKAVCPEIVLVKVPELNGKADLTKYRSASQEVMEVLSSFTKGLERASIDEAYLDITSVVDARLDLSTVTSDLLQSTYIVGCDYEEETGTSNSDVSSDEHEAVKREFRYEDIKRGECVRKWLHSIYHMDWLDEFTDGDRRLAVGGVLVEEIRARVYEKTGFKCSAGIAHNKVLAKLACGLHKPNRQTIFPQAAVPKLFATLPLKKVRNLGGKLGLAISEKLGCQTMAQVAEFSENHLKKHFGDKTGTWLYALAKGLDNEPVATRSLPNSIGCSKNFPGPKSLKTLDEVRHWLHKFSLELEERLVNDRNTNSRLAKLLNVSAHIRHDHHSGISKSCPLTSYEASRIAATAYNALVKLNAASGSIKHGFWEPPILSLGISASKFDKMDGKSANCLEGFLRGSVKTDSNEVSQDMGSDLETSNTTTTTTSITTVSSENPRDNSDLLNGDVDDPPKLPLYDRKLENVGQPSKLSSLIESSDARVAPQISNTDSPSAKPVFERRGSFGDIDIGAIDEETMSSLPTDIVAELKLNSKIAASRSNVCDVRTKRPRVDRNQSGIRDFFGVASTSTSTRLAAEVKTEDEFFCEKCSRSIVVWEWLEHQDYHVALELSRRSTTVTAGAGAGAGTVKRPNGKPGKKRSRTLSSNKVDVDKNARRIESFFK